MSVTRRPLIVVVAFLSLLLPFGRSVIAEDAEPKKYVFERIGQPMGGEPQGIEFVTKAPGGGHIAWAVVESPSVHAMLGIHTSTGEVRRLDTRRYGRTHIRIEPDGQGHIYIYTGNPGRFLKYEIATGDVKDLGVPGRPARYWIGHTVGPEGRIYVGSYPDARLVVCDPATDEVRDLGRLAEHPKQKYIIKPVAGPDGVIYCPVGLHHVELWAYDTRTGTKAQILPERLTNQPGRPRVWRGRDGQIYGRVGGTQFRCEPEGVVIGESEPHAEPEPDNIAGDYRALWIDGQGRLVLEHRKSGERRRVASEFAGAGVKIYSIGDVHDGHLYGGGFSPARLFRHNPGSGRSEDLGEVASGGVQIYDMLSHRRGLFISSYTGGFLDLYRPDQPRESGSNPRQIAKLSRGHQQERAMELVLGPDERIYTGTRPVKGRLGGALARIDLESLEVRVWRNVVPKQSCIALAPVAETGEMLVTSSISGGTGARPTAEEAMVFFWDCDEERITRRLKPIPDATHYSSVARARNGLIYGITSGRGYYAVDPETRTVVHTGRLPVKPRRAAEGLLGRPVGSEGLLYGIGEGGELFTIDPATHEARVVGRHKTLEFAHGAEITAEGTLYYGSGATLMRCRLLP